MQPGAEVFYFKRTIYDRVDDSDVKVTATGQIAQMYIRKQEIFTERKIYPYVRTDDLRLDLLPRLRIMAANNSCGQGHPWNVMTDKELLKSTRLYGTDRVTGESGYNLAAVMLLGTDEVILDVAPVYVTDAILRRNNTDRYDDREVIRKNLIESYDRLMAFAAKHLPDVFFLEGDQRKSLRTIISREMIANTLIHREYTSSYQAKYVIESNRMYVENANRAIQNARITPDNLEPYPKNPIIASFFRTVGLADQLGSGVRNLYKYCRFYSGEDPQFVRGDIFRIIVPVNNVFADHSDKEAGTEDNKNITDTQVDTQVGTQVDTQVRTQADTQVDAQADTQGGDHHKIMEEKILDFCKQPKSKAEIAVYCGYKSIKSLSQHYIRPLLDAGSLKMTIPDKPNSRLQKYVSVKNKEV